MKLNPLNVMLLQSGFIIITGLFTIAAVQFALSGDSTTPKPTNTMPLSTPEPLDPSLV